MLSRALLRGACGLPQRRPQARPTERSCRFAGMAQIVPSGSAPGRVDRSLSARGHLGEGAKTNRHTSISLTVPHPSVYCILTSALYSSLCSHHRVHLAAGELLVDLAYLQRGDGLEQRGAVLGAGCTLCRQHQLCQLTVVLGGDVGEVRLDVDQLLELIELAVHLDGGKVAPVEHLRPVAETNARIGARETAAARRPHDGRSLVEQVRGGEARHALALHQPHLEHLAFLVVGNELRSAQSPACAPRSMPECCPGCVRARPCRAGSSTPPSPHRPGPGTPRSPPACAPARHTADAAPR
eukprot:ctg_480.g156